MHIACFIYVLIALSFFCTVSAEEKLEKFMKGNFKNINKLDKRVTNLEGGDVVLDEKVENLNGEFIGSVVEFDAQVTSLNGYIADLGGQLSTTTDDLNASVVENEGKVSELNGVVINFDGTVTGLKEKLDGTVVKVTDLNEDITDISSHLEDQDGKIAELNGAVINFDRTVTGLKENLDGTVETFTDLNEDITDLSSHLEYQDGSIEKLKRLNEDHLLEVKDVVGGYEYAFIRARQPWNDHNDTAITWGSHLASVHSDGENNFILKRIYELNISYTCFIGGQRISDNPTDGSAKAWKWSHGTNWDYSVLGLNEPLHAREKLLGLYSPTGFIWVDITTEQSHCGV